MANITPRGYRAMPDMTMPDITTSIIIPSYNHGRFLAQTMASVLQEQDVALELIIIDDGSTDDSWVIISEFAQQDSRVRAFQQENQGAHAAINRGLALATGEFLAILNSDDLYSAGRLATLVSLAEEQDLDFIATGLQLIDGEGAAITAHPWLAEYQRMVARAEEDGVWAALLERNITVSTSNFFLRRTLYEQLGPIRPYEYNMDWDYVLRAYLAAPARFAWRADLLLWQYRLHGKNTILGGLPVSAIEANYLLLRSLKQHYGVPAAAVAGLRRHYKLIRQQQVAQVATARDTQWQAELSKTHEGWEITQKALAQRQADYDSMSAAHDAAHAQLGQTLTDLGAAREQTAAVQQRWEQSLTELSQSQEQLAQTQQQLAQVLASRSYRWGRKLTAPLRWAKQKFKPLAAVPTTTAPRSAPVTATPTVDPASLSIAVHLHLYYVDVLDELLEAVAQLPAPKLFVSTPHEIAPIEAAVQARFADAVVWHCPNQGKDIGPFIDAIHRFNLPQYDLVFKLHSKKSHNAASYMQVIRDLFGQDIKDGEDWRRKLITPLAGSPAQVQAILNKFAAQPQIGMIGAEQFLCTAPDADTAAYNAVCERLGIAQQPLFFGGTIFWIRGAVLQRFIDANFTLDDFNPAQQGAVENTLEHQLERVFGALVQSEGLTVQGIK